MLEDSVEDAMASEVEEGGCIPVDIGHGVVSISTEAVSITVPVSQAGEPKREMDRKRGKEKRRQRRGRGGGKQT